MEAARASEHGNGFAVAAESAAATYEFNASIDLTNEIRHGCSESPNTFSNSLFVMFGKKYRGMRQNSLGPSQRYVSTNQSTSGPNQSSNAPNQRYVSTNQSTTGPSQTSHAPNQ
ncbi:hypothetical protein [Sporosarcina newyorkensis]|uniref:hypothetical protein n=1 Tax=Sporosarcina newyorkensis TaxID=759851 RepID=UPI003F498470